MIRHIDTEMTVMKKEVCYTHRSLEMRGVAHCAGPPREVLESIRRQRKLEGKCRQELFLRFPCKRMGKAG